MKAYANFFACFLTFAHRFFAAFAIAALPAADKTRLLPLLISLAREGSAGWFAPENNLLI
jgi:hypothetical protein